MSEEKRVIKEKKIVNMTDLSNEKLEKATEMKLDVDNMNAEHEAMFSIELMNVPNEEKVSSTRIEMHGNPHLLISAIINTVDNDEGFRDFIFTLVDSVMVHRIANVTGQTPEEVMQQADEAAKKAEEEGEIILIAKGGDV